MTTRLKIDKAGTDDIDELVELRLAYLDEDHGGLDDEVAETIRAGLPDYFGEHLNRDCVGYVIRDGGEIASCAFLVTIEKPMSPVFLTGRTGSVMNMYTRPAYRRQGYATGIMTEMLNDARAKSLSLVELRATDAGYSVYKAVGFDDDHPNHHPMRWVNG